MVMVLERCYGPHQLHRVYNDDATVDDDDDDNESQNVPLAYARLQVCQ